MSAIKIKNKGNIYKASKSTNGVAIVGMACRVPGANNYNEFWHNLESGVDSIREINPDRWDIKNYYSPDIKEPNKSISKWCGLIENIDKFDNRFFDISPREAKSMDPQQRLLLEETWHCIEDSGISTDKLQKKKTSVHVGIMDIDYYQESTYPGVITDSYACLGNYGCILANRISYAFGLTGVSASIATACSSSLVAVHEAKSVLERGDSEYGIAAGINLNILPWKYISFSKSRMLSPDGKCKTFDKDANGYVPGDGVVILLLQRVDDAIRDGNNIYGVIKGSAVNHVGRGVSITAPTVEAQRDVILMAYDNAKISPESVSYVEAHGTGTSLGDPIEVEALSQAFGRYTEKKQFCKIGSVKTNIGHLEAAAGITGIIKVAMMMRHHKIPKILNMKTPNPLIRFGDSPFSLATRLSEWSSVSDKLPLRAGISSFGFGGTNSHVIMECLPQYEVDAECLIQSEKKEQIFVLSAKSVTSLDKQIKKFKNYTQSKSYHNHNLNEICDTLIHGRKVLPYRYGGLVKDKKDLEKLVRKHVSIKPQQNNQPWCMRIGEFSLDGFTRIRTIADENRLFQQKIEQIEKIMDEGGLYFRDNVWPAEVRPLYSFVIAYAYLSTIMEMGFQPQLIAFEKEGLWPALVLSGIMTIEDALSVLRKTRELSEIELSRPHTPVYDPVTRQPIMPLHFDENYLHMLVEDIEEIPPDFIDMIRSLSKSQFTFIKYIKEWDPVLKKSGKNYTEMLYDEGFWKSKNKKIQKDRLLLMVIVLSALRKLNRKWNLQERLPVKNKSIEELVGLVVEEVLPSDSIVELIIADNPNFTAIAKILNERQNKYKKYISLSNSKKGNGELAEIQNIREWVETALTDPQIPSVLSEQCLVFGNLFTKPERLVRSQSDMGLLNLREVVLELWLEGYDINLKKLDSGKKLKKISLPGYAFDRKSFWLDNNMPHRAKASMDITRSQIEQTEQLGLQYSSNFSLRDKIIIDHVITGKSIVPGASMIALALEAAQKTSKQSIGELKNIYFRNPGIVKDDSLFEVNIILSTKQFAVTTNTETLCTGEYETLRVKSSGSIDVFNDEKAEDLSNLYSQLANYGYDYGKSLQVIESLSRSEGYFLFKIKAHADQIDRLVEPALLDGFFQSVIASELLEGNMQNKEELYVPFHIETMNIFKEVPSNCLVRINKRDISLKGRDLRVSFQVYDTSGEGVLEINGMVFKRVSCEFLNSFSETSENKNISETVSYYKPSWKDQALDVYKQDSSRCAILFSGENDLSIKTSQEVRTYYDKAFIVKKGKKYQYVQNDHISINPESSHDYVNLVNKVFEETSLEACDIYFLWPFEDKIYSISEQSYLMQAIDDSVKCLFLLSKALVKRKHKGTVSIVIATSNVHVVSPNDTGEGYAYGGLSGLAKTIMIEIPRVKVKIIDFKNDDPSTSRQAAILLKENNSTDQAEIIAYRDHRRMVNFVEPHDMASNDASLLKKDGLYVLIGGAGGIGMHIAEMMAKKFNTRLVLIGRRKPDDEINRRIDRLARLGSEIYYLSKDVSDAEEAADAVKIINKKFGPINGIIQSGGVIEDKLIAGKDWNSFLRVLSPKVIGTWNINQLTRTQPLDFFVVFSSVTSVWGNSGQSDYSAANSFLDAFTHFRSKNDYPGQSKCINWTLWSDGGMGISPSVIKSFSKKTGVIESKSGVKAFNKLINGNTRQCIVTGKSLNLVGSTQETTSQETGDLIWPLTELLSKVLAIEIDELGETTDLRELGLDSITLTEYAESINHKFMTDIDATLLFEYSTINEISKYMKKHYLSQVSGYLTKRKIETKASTQIEERSKNFESSKYSNLTQSTKYKIPTQIRDLIEPLIEILSEVLEIEIEELAENTDLRELGLDSITLTEYAESINSKFATDIDSTLLFEYSTINEISGYLEKQYSSQLNDYFTNRKTEQETSSHIEIRSENKEASKSSNQEQSTEFILSSETYDLDGSLIEMLSKVLDIEYEELEKDTDLRELGLDSITLTEYAESINSKFATDIDPTLLFEYSTISEISTYLKNQYASQIENYFKHEQIMLSTDVQVEIRPNSPIVKNPVEILPNSAKKPGRNNLPLQENKDIAIIGISGKFPGSKNVEEFWNNLIEGRDLITEISKDRWDWENTMGDPMGKTNKSISKHGGFLDDMKVFDAGFFRISPREAEMMDPQQRLMMQEVWHAIEDSGYKPSSLSGTDTGIFIGVCNSDYSDLMLDKKIRLDASTSTGTYFSIIPNRISYFLNIHGPSIAIDTACSSSLIAIHQAIQAIRNKDCKMAFAGGVNICCTPRRYFSFSHAGMLSKDGRCKTFDESANGYVRGEGLGVILLKPLKQALVDGDYIYGLIKASATNHGGFSNSLTAPNTNAQCELLVNVYEKAGFDPTTISYIEAHGTGTILGDPIEVNGLKKAFSILYEKWGKSTSLEPHCGLGSVKTNIGHLETAAGIAGVIKVLMAMKHKQLPPSIHCSRLNQRIQLKESPFYIVDKVKAWKKPKDKNGDLIHRRAGVSSFGFGGANAHVVIEEFENPEIEFDNNIKEQHLIILSAKSKKRLKKYAAIIFDYLMEQKLKKEPKKFKSLLLNVSYTLMVCREPMEERLAMVVSSMEDLIHKLEQYITGKIVDAEIHFGRIKRSRVAVNQAIEIENSRTIDRRYLNDISKMWVSSEEINFNSIFSKSRPSRIFLPKYPFASEIYWMPDLNKQNHVSVGDQHQSAELNPLIDLYYSGLNDKEFTIPLTGNEYLFNNHVVNGKKTLPGVAYLEMANSAGKITQKKDITKIQNIVWAKPISENELSKKIQVKLSSNANGIRYEIVSKHENEEELHAQGKLVYDNEDHDESECSIFDIDAIKNNGHDLRSGTYCYTVFKKKGFNYGSGFQAIKKLYCNKIEALSIIELPVDLKNDFDRHTLHPSLMDAALQTVIALLDNSKENHHYLPYMMKEVRILRSLREKCYAYAKLKEKQNSENEKIKKFDILIIDEAGQILVKMVDFSLKADERNTHKSETKQKLTDDEITMFLQKLELGELSTDEVELLTEGYYE